MTVSKYVLINMTRELDSKRSKIKAKAPECLKKLSEVLGKDEFEK